MKVTARFIKISEENRYVYIFSALIFLFVSGPILHEFGVSTVLWEGLQSITILSCIYAASDTRKHIVGGLGLGLPAFVLLWLNYAWSISFLPGVSIIVNIFFYMFMIYLIGQNVLAQKEVTLNMIFGAVSIYLLVTIVFTYLFSLLDVIIPEELFNNMSGLDFSTAAYFSFVTISTLGYGDIVPVHSVSQIFSVLLAVAGQFYIAIVMAVLVSKYSTKD